MPIFEGLRVLDLSQNVAGAVAGMILSDHGAAVIKVEPPGGDPGRDLAGWLVWRRGAKSLVLDLDQVAGRDVLLRLITSADELVEARLGLQYEQLGYRDGPIYLGWPLAEYGGAFLTAIGLVAALYVRAVSGKGQLVDVSLANGAAFLVGIRWGWGEQTNLAEAQRRDPDPRGAMGNRRVVIGLFQCQDGSWVQMHTAPRG